MCRRTVTILGLHASIDAAPVDDGTSVWVYKRLSLESQLPLQPQSVGRQRCFLFTSHSDTHRPTRRFQQQPIANPRGIATPETTSRRNFGLTSRCHHSPLAIGNSCGEGSTLGSCRGRLVLFSVQRSGLLRWHLQSRRLRRGRRVVVVVVL